MISRRQFLCVLGAAAAGSARAQLDPDREAQRKAAMEEAVRKVTGGAPVRRGKVKLDIPPLIDNGNAVPLAVSVESPMTAADHVKAIHVFTQRNPQPYVINAYLGPRAGRARIETRARIADTQTVTAIAQLSDGSFWSDSADVVVTLSACLEEGLI
jgi:sulfur-oxidizing protein SoxY